MVSYDGNLCSASDFNVNVSNASFFSNTFYFEIIIDSHAVVCHTKKPHVSVTQFLTKLYLAKL